jgi:phage host-nuclease inhibitor protein Gam
MVPSTADREEGREPVVSLPVGGPSDDLAPEGHAGPWQPQTIRDVEWCLERVGEAEADRLEILAQMDAARDAILKRGTAIIDKAECRAEWFRSLAESYAAAHRDEFVRGKSKSRELLSGTVGFRASAEKVVVVDEAAAIAWASESHLELLDLKPRLDKRALSKFVLGSGEIPPGCDVTPATEAVYVKTNPLPTLDSKKQESLP